MKRVAALAALLIVLGLVLTACANSGNETGKLIQEYAPRVVYLAPDFQLTDYKGSPVKLSVSRCL